MSKPKTTTAAVTITTGSRTDTIRTKPMDADTARELTRLADAAGVPITTQAN